MSWKWEEREVWKSGWGKPRCSGEVGVRFGGESFWSESGGKQRLYTWRINGSKSGQQLFNSWLISWQKRDPETRWKWEEGGAKNGGVRTTLVLA